MYGVINSRTIFAKENDYFSYKKDTIGKLGNPEKVTHRSSGSPRRDGPFTIKKEF